MGVDDDQPPDRDLVRISREIELHTTEMQALADIAAATPLYSDEHRPPPAQIGRHRRRTRNGAAELSIAECELRPTKHATEEEGLLDYLFAG